jgi:hypothetical protein
MKKSLIAITLLLAIAGIFAFSILNDDMLFLPRSNVESLNLEVSVVPASQLEKHIGKHNLPDELKGEFIVIKAHPDKSIQNKRTSVVEVKVCNEIVEVIPKGELLQDKDYFGILKPGNSNHVDSNNLKFKLLDYYTK